MMPTVIAVLVAGPTLDEPYLSLHTTGEQADEAFLVEACRIHSRRFGYVPPAWRSGLVDVDAVIARLVEEGYTVAIGERTVEL